MKQILFACALALSLTAVAACGDPVAAPSVVTRPVKGSPVSILDTAPRVTVRDTNPPPPKRCPDGSPVSILDGTCPDPIP